MENSIPSLDNWQNTPYENEISLRTACPSAEIHFESVYVPVRDESPWEWDTEWGLYHRDGYIIDAAAYYRGPGKTLIGQSPYRDLAGVALEVAPPGRYLYGGNIISHFGHYLLNPFSRFWIGTKLDLAQFKIVCHGAGTPAQWWQIDFLRELFSSQGLTEQHFVVFKRPTLIPEIMVPRPACEERNFVHTAYADWGHQVGRALIRDRNLPAPQGPVWFAKTRLGRGIRGLDNEQSLIDRLESGGVETMHPHELTMAEKVVVYATRSAVMGLAGSTLHSSIFWPAKCKLIGVGLEQRVDSNNAIADKANNNQAFYCSAKVDFLPPNDRFDQPLRILNVDEVADKILSLCNSQSTQA